MPSFDAIIIGGGTNGLACAARLQKSGRKVLVLESGSAPGGGALGADFAPGYRAPGLAHLVHMLDARVETDMDLARHGLSWAATDLPSTALSATGDHLVMEGAAGERLTGSVSAEERRAWAALRTELMAFADVLAPFKELTPPRLAKGVGNDVWQLGKLGLKTRMMGKDRFREFLRMLLINVHDVLNDELTDPRLKGLLAHDAVLGTWLGPRSPNSLIHLLNRFAGQVAGKRASLAVPAGGMGAVAAAMAASATASGVTIRTGAAVAALIVEGDRTVGVTLASGEDLRAATIISAISPKTTFLKLLGPRHLDTGFVNRIRHMKSRGGAAKLNLALKGRPDFRGADLRSRLVIAPDEHAVELAFNAVKYGEAPDRPVMEILVPSAFEGGHAPDGHHVLSAIVQFAPCGQAVGTDAIRERYRNQTLAVLEQHAPGLADLIVGEELMLPADIEARHGMVGGNWHHGELSVEQMLFLRPVPGIAQYQGPIAGLWLAGAGCHPGGGISGAAGWNAAERIVREVRS